MAEVFEVPVNPAGAPVDAYSRFQDEVHKERQRSVTGKKSEAGGQPYVIKVDTEHLYGERLDQIVKALHDKMFDSKTVESLIMSVPPGDRKELARRYEAAYHHSLSGELKQHNYEQAINHLERHTEPQRELSELKDRLTVLSRLPANCEERNILEHSIRDQLRKLPQDQLKLLSEANNGQSLQQLIDSSSLSPESKKAAAIYLSKGCEQLDANDRTNLADLALSCNSPQRRLLMLQEALGGEGQVADQARQQFLKNGGEGRLKGCLSGDDLRQALDIARTGKSDISTRIERVSSSMTMNDTGVVGILNQMSPQDHALYKKGMEMQSAPPPGSPDRAAYDYYNRIHESLVHATRSAWFSDANKKAQLDAWEDIAANGHTTLLGRIARCNDPTGICGSRENAVVGAIRNFTDEDYELMKNPAYKKRVYEALYGEHGNNAYFDWSTRRAGDREIQKVFGDASATNAKEARANAHALLRDAVLNHASDESFLYVLSKAKAKDWNDLYENEKREFQKRVDNMPQGPREEAQRLLEQIKRGENPQVGFSTKLRLDELHGASNAEKVKHIFDELKNNPKAFEALKKGQDPNLDKALHDVFRNPGEYDKYVKPLLTNASLPLKTVSELYKGKDIYDNLHMVSAVERLDIKDIAKRAEQNDAAAKRALETRLPGLTDDQRQSVVQILSNKDKAPSLADRIHLVAIGDRSDNKQLVAEVQKLSMEDKKRLLSEYSDKYHSPMAADWSGKTNDRRIKDDIMACIPTSLQEQYRTHQRQAEQQAIQSGAYSNSVPLEQSMEATNKMIKYNLAHLSPEKQAELKTAEDDLQKFMKDSQEALRTNRLAKDEYAKEMTDKIMTMAYIIAAPATGGASLSPLLCAVALSTAARPLLERAMRGEELSPDEFRAASLSGAVDGVLAFGGFRHIKGVVTNLCKRTVIEGLEQSGVQALKPEVKETLQRNLEKELSKGNPLDANLIHDTVVPPELRGTPQGHKIAESLARNLEKNIYADAEGAVKDSLVKPVEGRMQRVSMEVPVGSNDQVLASNIQRLRDSIPVEQQAARRAAAEASGTLRAAENAIGDGRLKEAAEALKKGATDQQIKQLDKLALLEAKDGSRQYVNSVMEDILKSDKTLTAAQKEAIRNQMKTDIAGALQSAKEQMPSSASRIAHIEPLLDEKQAREFAQKQMNAMLDGQKETQKLIENTLNFNGTPEEMKKGMDAIAKNPLLKDDPNVKQVVERLKQTLDNAASSDIQRLLRVGEHYTEKELEDRLRKNVFGEVLKHGDGAGHEVSEFVAGVKDPKKYLEELKKQPLDYLKPQDREAFSKAIDGMLKEIDENLAKRALLSEGPMPSIFGQNKKQVFKSAEEAAGSLPQQYQAEAKKFFKNGKSYGWAVQDAADGSGRKMLMYMDPSHKAGDAKMYMQILGADGKPVGPRVHILWDEGTANGAKLSSIKVESEKGKSGADMVRLYDRYQNVHDSAQYEQLMKEAGFKNLEEMEAFFSQAISAIR